jgi:threonylcarbamoyladenosine tRNA methylthiotransferase MtaB
MSVEVLSFGCRLNGVEAETMRGRAAAAGLRDLVVVNTCAVTAEAGRQARQAIRKARRERPEARIVVTGCGAEVETEAYAGMHEVGTILGNAEKMEPGLWTRLREGAVPPVDVGGLASAQVLAQAGSDAGAGRVRAFVEIQNGCDHSCTFCTIPAGRGRSRSAPAPAVIESVRGACEAGAREVVLTGVDVTAYGFDLGAGAGLGRLVKAILAALPELPRLRLSSIDSVEADDDLRDAMATEPRLMPHLHLSLQAGDDLILKRMKRRHSHADAVRFCEEMRRLRPDIVFGADLIAGFPTETEAMFRRSLDLVEACGLTHLHVFPYSARPGTPASRMPAVPAEEVRERAARLRAAGEVALARHLASEVGRTREVLVEGSGTGRTEGFAPVKFERPPAKGALGPALILGHDGRALVAEFRR